MSLFDLNPTADQNLMDQARLNPIQPDQLAPAWYAGAWKAPVTGLASAVNDAALLLGDAATPVARTVARPIDKVLGTTAIDDWLTEQQQIANRNITGWTPDARTTGWLGQAVHGLFNVVPEAALGGPETAAALQGYKGMKRGQNEGLDSTTALGVGAIDAVSTWVGLKLPMQALPTWGAAGAVVTGAGGNVVTGAISRGATGEWLRQNGYTDMAAQYKVLDSQAIAIDLLMGGGFGALAHYGPAAAEKYQAWREKKGDQVMPSDVDAALAMNNQLHVELDTAPGVPTTPQARAAHVEAVNDALSALMRDDPVVVKPGVAEAEFIENPQAESFREQVGRVVEEHLDQIDPGWRALKVELEKRGLPTDEIDASGTVRVAKTTEIPRELEGVVMGSQSAVKISGQYVPVRWAVVDAGQVEATMAKADNQFRDRTRAASEAQVNRIAADPDYNLLNDSPIMDFGAPTLTRDGRIVGGNGRFAGVSRSYDRGTHKRYSEPMARNLERYGIDPEAAKGMKKPVLVRVLQADVDVKKAAMASNEGAGLRMSALEQAKVDAERLGGMDGVTVGETGRLNTPDNRGAIRQWVGQFPATERAALVDANGNLSAEGETRLRNAVLFKAYGDSPTLARLVESTDPGARNVASALLRTAPVVAEVKASIEAGALYPLDISADIASAVETLDRLRGEGTKIADYLNQGDMLGSGLSSEARLILQFMDENIRSAKAMSEMIGDYYEGVKAAGNPDQGDMFGGEPASKMQILEGAIAKTGKSVQAGLAELPFDGKAPAELKQQDLERLPESARGQLQRIYRQAAETKPTFDALNEQIASDLGGEYKGAPLKGGKRAVDKIVADYKGDPTKIKDVLRGSIIVPDPVRAMAAVEELRSKFQVLDSGFRNLFDEGAKTVDGYRDAKMNIVIDGVHAEIQVHVPEMIKAKSEVHDLYEERSRIERETEGRERTPDEQAHIDALNAAMREVYDPAWAASTSRLNLASETGAPLRRADSAENLRGGSSSQAAQENGTSGTLPKDTGMPSTSKNSTEAGKAGNFIDFTSEGSLPDLAGVVKNAIPVEPERAILQERPTLRIPGEDGSVVPAAIELAKADAEIASSERESQGFDAAVSCVLRG